VVEKKHLKKIKDINLKGYEKNKKEIEVFRITPVVGKCYETAENTRKEKV
jgi:hypothetical protein